MLRTGKVVSAKHGKLEVCFVRPEACAHCNACGEAHESIVNIPGDAPVGSWIDVDMPEKQVLKASMIAYVLPLLLLLGGIALGTVLFGPGKEPFAALLGILFMAASWIILRLVDRRMRKNDVWQPKIVAIHEAEGAN